MSDHPENDQSNAADNYDATRDPRTGRPPEPAEAQKLAREHHENRANDQLDEDGLGEADGASGIEGQQPARMTSPEEDHSEKDAVDALVQEGFTRERAEELVSAHGVNWETLKAAAFAQDNYEPK
ncbi:MAG: hypothetical protein ACOZAM_04570 [Pseudomonadota bacterium]